MSSKVAVGLLDNFVHLGEVFTTVLFNAAKLLVLYTKQTNCPMHTVSPARTIPLLHVVTTKEQ